LLTGKSPFRIYRGMPLAQVIPRMIADRARVPWLRKLNPQVTPAVEAIVRKCLDPDPALRYTSGHDLCEDLQRHLANLPLRHAKEPSLIARFVKFRRRHPRLLSASTFALALLLCSSVFGSALYWRGERVADLEAGRLDRAEGFRRESRDVESRLARGLARLPGDPDAALAEFDAALELDPRSLAALQDKAHVLVRYRKQTEEAVRVLDRAVALYPEDVRPRAGRGVLLARLGRNAAARADAELALTLEDTSANQYQVAGIYAWLSREDATLKDTAFRLLGSALKKGFGHDLLATDPDLVPIRDDPRFARLQSLIGTLGAGR